MDLASSNSSQKSRGWGPEPGGEGEGTARQIVLVYPARDPQQSGFFSASIKCVFSVLCLHSLTLFFPIIIFFSYSRVDPYVQRSIFVHQ